jgi:hypothetical protein
MSTPMNRRAVLGALASVSGLSIPFVIAPSNDPDAELLAVSAEVLRMSAMTSEFEAAHIEPFNEKFEYLIHDDPREWDVRWAEAAAWGRKTGRDAAINKLGDMEREIDLVFRRMIGIPATTQAGRAAKVRIFLVHVGRSNWRGPGGPLDWDHEMARTLLGEFAGMSAEEIANV